MFATNLFVLLLLIYGALSLAARPVPLPGWVGDAAERRLVDALAPGGVGMGELRLLIGRDGLPRLMMSDITVTDAGGAPVARLNEMTARLSPTALVSGRLAPSILRLSGAQITLRRGLDGALALSFGGGGAMPGRTVADVLSNLDAALDTPGLAAITRVEAQDLTITLEDARSGRIWQAANASIDLERGSEGLAVTMLSDVFNGTDDLASIRLSLEAGGGAGAELSATIKGVPSADIALQSPALSFLGLLDAPIDGSLRAGFGRDGRLDRFAATLEIGAGAFQPSDNTAIGFTSGRSYLTYDPNDRRIDFSNVAIESDVLDLAVEGHAYLRDVKDGWPARLVGQFDLREARINAEGLLVDPVLLADGAADLNLRFDPFEVRFGQLMLAIGEGDERETLRASGSAGVAPDGWEIGLDFGADRLSPRHVLAAWPLDAAKGSRKFVAENVLDGRLNDVRGAVRIAPDAPPRIAAAFEFSEARVRALKHFPPIEAGRGHGSLENDAFTLVLEQGQVQSGAGPVNLRGSSFQVPDLTVDREWAEIDLRTASTLKAALTLLDNKPFEVLRKSGLPADLAQARVESRSEISFALLKDIRKEDVSFSTSGTLRGLTSETLVPGRVLSAEEVFVEVDPEAVELSGAGQVDDIPVAVTWTQPLAQEAAETSRLEATLPLTPETLDSLGGRLPPGLLSGKGEARLVLNLQRSGPTELTVTSDLAGLGLRLDGVGWSKPAASTGAFELSGTLGPALSVDRVRLDAPGLSAEGGLTLGEAGTFTGAAFDRVRLGDWFEGPVTLAPSPSGGPMQVSVLGGSVDLRFRPPAAGGGGDAAMAIALEELVISDSMVLRPFTARMPASGAGRFDARVAGRTAIEGELIPQPNGLAIRMRSSDGGRALADAGILKGAVGGDMTVTLVPDGTPGGFDGQLAMQGVTLRDAPTIAYLLDSISVVGLLDELDGPGIRFETVDARFGIGGGRLTIFEAAAVGGSLGISLHGTYDLARRQLDMQGVLSPIYLLNQIGSIFTRPGEGLFGVNFRLTGPASAPGISVNPLSILTPGMFREIFRRPPPGRAATQ